METASKILYLSYDGMTDPLGQSQVLTYLTGLSKKGLPFTLISAEKPDRFALSKNKITDMCIQAGIHWQPMYYTKSPPVLSTLYDTWQMWRGALRLHREKHFALVHCRGYIPSLVGLALKQKTGMQFIFDMRGFWADEKVDAGVWQLTHPVYRRIYNFFKRKERVFVLQSDAAVSLTHVGKDLLIKEYGVEADKIHIIPTCVNMELFKPYDSQIRATYRTKLDLPKDKFIVLYSGSLGGNYNTNFIAEVLQAVKKICPAHLLVLSQTDKATVECYLAKAGIKNFTYVNAEYSEVAAYLMTGDLGVVNYNVDYSVAGRSPTKLGEYWSCGLPCVTPKGVGDLDFLKLKFPDGLFYSDEISSQNFIARVQNEAYKKSLRTYAASWFELNQGVENYFALYSKLLGKKI